MSRAQDQFIDDDEEETCPLCVEELDLTDKGFKPCPCGYQICQFCYNNVKNNMNGLCPACRRPYSDKDIEYKLITPEETAAHKARQAQKQKKNQAAFQKERQKQEAESLSRKHLAGQRVVQKNLVYVTGLAPSSQEDQLLQTLRGPDYFGQYGKIIKIVVSKARDISHPHSIGVYVTYEKKEDAVTCIEAVDGSRNGERTLRAQFGTTKYCSAYLRGDQCTNRNCMFLHEPGEANDSYSRADLSLLNARHSGASNPPPQSHQPVASAAPSAIQRSTETASPAPDGPALPSTASWASKSYQPIRSESRSTNRTHESPAVLKATPAPIEPEPQMPVHTENVEIQEKLVNPPVPKQPRPRRSRGDALLVEFLKQASKDELGFVFSYAGLSEDTVALIENYPPLFDGKGGARKKMQREREGEAARLQEESQRLKFQEQQQVGEQEDSTLSGSMQLGGEPEERQGLTPTSLQQGVEGALEQRFQFGGVVSPGISDRGTTPQQQQQHQQLLLQTMKSPGASYLTQQNAYPVAPPQPQSNAPLGHQRNTSRFSFANDQSATTSVRPVANPKLMSQQSSMMPSGSSNHFSTQQQQQQQHGNQFFTSNVQGPPPGLKTTGTPPVSGGMTFGQGHGFATGGLQYGSSANRNPQEDIYNNLLRTGARGATSITATDKHDTKFPPLGPPSRQASISIQSRHSLDESRTSTPPVPPGFEAQAASLSRRSTPTVPPGFGKPTALPGLEDGSPSRPSSRTGIKRTTSAQIHPILPVRPATPPRLTSRSATPITSALKNQAVDEVSVKKDATTEISKGKGTGDVGQHGLAFADQGAQSKRLDGPEEVVRSKQVDDIAHIAAALPQTPTKESIKSGKDGVTAILTDLGEKATAPNLIAAKDASKVATPPSKDQSGQADNGKRKHPGKLDIAAAVREQQDTAKAAMSSIPTDAIEAVVRQSTSTRASQQATPWTERSESPSVSSPVSKSAAPRTLRVVQTPKVETPAAPALPTQQPPLASPAVAAVKAPSRQPSVTSINPPGTPSSEQVSMSDNISITSTSVSRASSPPPPGAGRVGSAPVRAKTKNQLKKERQERAKALEEEKKAEGDFVEAVREEPQQEAIVSRKKKTKKGKEPKPQRVKTAMDTAGDTPTASRPASPGIVKQVPIQQPQVAEDVKSRGAYTGKPNDGDAVKSEPLPPTPPSPFRSQEPFPLPTTTFTPASLLAELKASAPEIQKSLESLFRTPNSNYFRPPYPIDIRKDVNDPDWDISELQHNLRKQGVAGLINGKMPYLRYYAGDADEEEQESARIWDRVMVTPSGAHLRALSEELELRFLELEKTLKHVPENLKFHPSKPQLEARLPQVDLEGLRRQFQNFTTRGVSVMEQMVNDGGSVKKGALLVDEAGKYIDEFVMPPATSPPPPPPPPATNANVSGGIGKGGQQGTGLERERQQQHVESVEILERQLNEAKRVADEKEAHLKRQMKKNKKILGFN